MIAKQAPRPAVLDDPRQRAGAKAEQDMVFYLHRSFAQEPSVHVLHDLRLVDSEQPDPDGAPGVCQIDHLVVHRWGMFIIECKSIIDEVTVRGDGAGGDEWTRRYQGREVGFPSPIQQARRQAEFLREFLQRDREQLLGRVSAGLRTLTKLIAGSDQRSFRKMPIQIIVAISDRGKISRVGGWKEPAEPFRTFVSKADGVPEKVRRELGQHRSSARLVGEMKGDYGMWAMKPEEAAAVAAFLAGRHTPRSATPPSRAQPPQGRTARAVVAPETAPTAPRVPPKSAAPNAPACKSCGSAKLIAQWGKYGYYWKCGDCGANTSMPTVCSACGAEGGGGKVVRIRKEGPKFYRCCEACGIEERIWTAT